MKTYTRFHRMAAPRSQSKSRPTGRHRDVLPRGHRARCVHVAVCRDRIVLVCETGTADRRTARPGQRDVLVSERLPDRHVAVRIDDYIARRRLQGTLRVHAHPGRRRHDIDGARCDGAVLVCIDSNALANCLGRVGRSVPGGAVGDTCHVRRCQCHELVAGHRVHPLIGSQGAR